MSLYRQEPEARLLATLLARLDRRTVIDVGAERGSLAAELLVAGADEIHAIEPEPRNAQHLRERFRDEPHVTVHECAVSNMDGEVRLHRSFDASGEPVPFGHTLLEVTDTEEIAWRDTVTVTGRSLASLVRSGELPGKVGILKIDTEGNDLHVVEGMGGLDSDVVMVEYWTDLPQLLGPCPWTSADVQALLGPRGFGHFALVAHRGPFSLLQWDDATVATGEMGNLVFLHDRVLDRFLTDILAIATALAQDALATAEVFVTAATERLDLVERLDAECRVLQRQVDELSRPDRALPRR